MKKSVLSSLFSTTFLITGVTTATLINSPSAEARAVTRPSNPVKEETKITPVKEEVKVTPVKEEVKVTPVKEEVKVTPVKEEVKITPVKEETKITPVTDTTATDTKNDPKTDNSVTSGTGTKDVAAFCKTSDAKIGSIIATACKGPMEGNDTGSDAPLLTSLNKGLFSDFVSSSYTWAMAGKSDESDSFGFEADNGASAGSWLLNKALPSSTFVLSLKTSTAYSAYLFTNVDFSVTGLKGVFDTIGVALDGSGKAGKALSHASLFYVTNQTPPPPPPVVDEKPPVVDEKPPVVDEKPPVVDEKPPVVDEKPPVVDEKPPVVDEKPPVVDEKPPVEQEKPPVDATKVPEPGTIAALMMMGGATLLRARRKH